MGIWDKARRFGLAIARNPRVVVYRAAHVGGWLLPGPQRYLAMQRDYYERHATLSDFASGVVDDGLVGHYEKHNAWPDYDAFLMRDLLGGIALDFACGPARNIIKYRGAFDRIDGCDISPRNIANARQNLKRAQIADANLYVTSGGDVGNVGEQAYDLIFSTIALQHIAVHELRLSIFQSMFRALKPSGWISIQMGYGSGKPGSVDYYANAFGAPTTNSAMDVRVESPDQLGKDLTAVGYIDFQSWVRPPGPGDTHPNWIFFRAQRPAA